MKFESVKIESVRSVKSIGDIESIKNDFVLYDYLYQIIIVVICPDTIHVTFI